VVAAGGRLRLDGMIVGTLQVESGGYAHVRGLVQGLVVESGGSAQLDGMCAGNVFNMGGELTIAGMVVGRLHGQMYTRIMPGSRIIAA
jgi:cytoskeletal protein CcmA (bactofilin family)